MKLESFVIIISCMLLGGFLWGETEKLLPPPDGFIKLLEVDARGGRVFRPQNFVLHKPGAEWNNRHDTRMDFVQLYEGYGAYRLTSPVLPPLPKHKYLKAIGRGIWCEHPFKFKHNRNYIVSVLCRTDFDRDSTELTFTFRLRNKSGNFVSPRQCLGAPAKTTGPDGWQRLEWLVTAASNPQIEEASANISIQYSETVKPLKMEIADFAFVELPAVPLEILPPGEGVTFPGSVGDLPMQVESATQYNSKIEVLTTGAKYVFDVEQSTLLAHQRIEFPRELAHWQSSLSFANLKIVKQNNDVCVLANDLLTIGVQADSLLLITPQKPLNMRVTNLLGGDWNRYGRGSMLSLDDFGGFTVSPYMPAGTGVLPQSRLLTPDLAFEKLVPKVGTSLSQPVKHDPYMEEPGSEKPGWQAEWDTVPGTYFTTSVFPPRPYPWQDSFEVGYKSFNAHQRKEVFEKEYPYVSTWLLWDFLPRQWGRSYDTEYSFGSDPEKVKAKLEIVNMGRERGKKIIYFMSMYWSHSRDPEEYVRGVKNFHEKYGIDGLYSDGIPSVDWMVAYKEIRMLREFMPSGIIVVHDSMAQDGWWLPEFKPFIHTYATATVLAENEYNQSGSNWQYPRYITTQFRKANSIGLTLGTKWNNPDGELMQEEGKLTTLVYNGRESHGRNYPRYYECLAELEKLWHEKGSEPYFYDRYYLPTAQKLTGKQVGRTAMPIVSIDNNKVTLETLSPDAVIYYTLDGSEPTSSSLRYSTAITLSGSEEKIRARAFTTGLDPSVIATEPVNCKK